MTIRTLTYGFLCLAAIGAGRKSVGEEAPNNETERQRPALAVEAFSLSQVRLLDSPFKQAMERNAEYLLRLEPDRLLHNTRKYAGLEPKGEIYGGWEAKGIAGHTLGHYLTAISQQLVATGDQRFRERIDYIISEMAECQKAYGDGYIGALPPKELETLRGFKQGTVELSGGFNFKGGAWVPWYTQHKILAGLKDAWALGGNQQAKTVAIKLADWIDDVTAGLTPDQLQTMLKVEQGGMAEALVELYALTDDPRYLEVARRFQHRAILDPLLAGRDELVGKHANTQIPKITGAARLYEQTGDADARKIAELFWQTVVSHHTFAIGGNSDGEHFFAPAKAGQHLRPATAETCNTYNMLKLTEHLIQWDPKVEYADYYERALYNHILASQEPRQGMFAYYVSLKPGLFRTYSTPFDAFWCCVGTGMENHTKYGKAIYFHDANDVYVNLFVPSQLTWPQKSLVLEQRTDYPRGDQTEFVVSAAPSDQWTLHVRTPGWADGPLAIRLNDQPLDNDAAPGQYAAVTRVWKAGDRLKVTIPLGLRREALEGAPDKVAFLYGPLVLAGDFGPVEESKSFPYAKGQNENSRKPTADVPVLVAEENAPAEDLLEPADGSPLAFRTKGVGKPGDAILRPFVDLPYNRYTVYWDVLSPAQWTEREAQKDRAERPSK